MMLIRPAFETDIDTLAALAASAYRAAFARIIGEAGLALRDAAFFSQRFAVEWRFISVAANTERAITGFAEVRDGTLDMLFIEPALTGKAIGAFLLADAEARGAIRLECFEENRAARHFYARHGWRDSRAYSREFAGNLCHFVAMEKPRAETGR